MRLGAARRQSQRRTCRVSHVRQNHPWLSCWNKVPQEQTQGTSDISTADPQLSCPMVRKEHRPDAGKGANTHCSAVPHQDYFVFEPCLVRIDNEVQPVIPLRFFERGKATFGLVAHLLVTDDQAWVVMPFQTEVPLDQFFMPYNHFLDRHALYNMPSPECVERESES